MLVLTRKKDEALRVEIGGQEVWVYVISVQGNRVRLGVEAARDVTVQRAEIAAANRERPDIPAAVEIEVPTMTESLTSETAV